MSLIDFYKKLETLRKPKPDDPYDNRVTHCYLLHYKDGKNHRCSVRGWGEIKDGVLEISIVNYTLCAGYAVLELTEELVPEWAIEQT